MAKIYDADLKADVSLDLERITLSATQINLSPATKQLTGGGTYQAPGRAGKISDLSEADKKTVEDFRALCNTMYENRHADPKKSVSTDPSMRVL